MNELDGIVECSPDCNILDRVPEELNRRALRKALRSCDVNKVHTILNNGCDVNTIVNDVYQDTALTWSVKNGQLEVVELLVNIPACDLDTKDRNRHTSLDEAIKRWLNAAVVAVRSSNSAYGAVNLGCFLQDSNGTTTSTIIGANSSKQTANSESGESLKLHLGVQYRILKCLLEAGASVISSTHLDMTVFQTLSAPMGQSMLLKLSKLVSDKGQPHIRSVLLSILVTYRMTHDCVKCLLEAGADPRYYLTKEPSRPFMPVENALLLLRVCNDEALLSRIECDTTGHLSCLNDQQVDQLLLVLRLLVVCGHSLQLYVMNFLREHRLSFYMWTVRQGSRPRTLLSLARIKIRKHLKSNVVYCYGSISSIPEELKQYLLLSEWLVPKKKTVGQ